MEVNKKASPPAWALKAIEELKHMAEQQDRKINAVYSPITSSVLTEETLTFGPHRNGEIREAWYEEDMDLHTKGLQHLE